VIANLKKRLLVCPVLEWVFAKTSNLLNTAEQTIARDVCKMKWKYTQLPFFLRRPNLRKKEETSISEHQSDLEVFYMKIKYVFADGTVSEVEVDDEYGRLHLEAERKIENDSRRWRYHVKASLDNCDYEGEWFQDPNPTPHEQMLIDTEYAESEKKVQEFKKTLTDIQLKRLEMLEQGMTQREIADREGVNLNAVQKSIEQIRKKYRRFFDK